MKLQSFCKFCNQLLPCKREDLGTTISCPHCGLNTVLEPGKAPRDAKYCVDCGTVATPKTRTKGSFGIELILWLAFIVPGILYSLWRLTSRAKVCPSCGSEMVIPIDSPRAQKLMEAS